ncbi:MAG: lecithin retinol acyltransferase family protein [Pirellulales bacterium]
MARGDHIYVEDSLRGIPFQHHGIDVGDGYVIHLAPEDGARVTLRDQSERFAVRRVTLEEFAADRSVKIRTHHKQLSADEVVAAAEKRLGQCGYSLLEGNCEHFATACATGEWVSHQIEMSHGALSCVGSAATKAICSFGSKFGLSAVIRGATKTHPAILIADGVELVALTVGCKSGLPASSAKQVARVSGTLTAFGIGAIVAGPAGAVASMAAHEGSRKVADKLCQAARRILG